MLQDIVNDSINNNNIENVYNTLKQMRTIHGELIHKLNKTMNEKPDDEQYFNISHLTSLTTTINNKIVESELKLNEFMKSKPPLFNGKKSNESLVKSELSKKDNFDVNFPTLMLFYNPGCPACAQTKPYWDELVSTFKKNKKVFNIMEINLADESNQKLAEILKIKFIPTIIFTESSNKPSAKIERMEGQADKKRIQEFINNSLNKFMNK